MLRTSLFYILGILIVAAYCTIGIVVLKAISMTKETGHIPYWVPLVWPLYLIGWVFFKLINLYFDAVDWINDN